MQYITRKSLLYKTEVEYGDYTINHVEGCSHGCKYPCYAFMMAKRFGRTKSYEQWIEPKLVINAPEILEKEIPKLKDKIQSVHFCFTTDPFMYGYSEISDMTLELMKMLNNAGVKCTALTKGLLPIELAKLSQENEVGITLISMNEEFREQYEPNSALYMERIQSLWALHDIGVKTWVSIEPYPTPNIIKQDFQEILNTIGFVDKIVFGRMNYNSLITKYSKYKDFFNQISQKVVDFCEKNGKEYHIKKGTISAL